MVAALPYLFDTLDKDLLISFENEMKLEISAISVAINLSRQDDISKSLKLYSKALETGKEIIGLAGLIHSLVLDIKKLEISDENKKAIASIVSQIPDEDRKPQSDWFKPRSISPRASETQDSNINNSNIPN